MSAFKVSRPAPLPQPQHAPRGHRTIELTVFVDVPDDLAWPASVRRDAASAARHYGLDDADLADHLEAAVVSHLTGLGCHARLALSAVTLEP